MQPLAGSRALVSPAPRGSPRAALATLLAVTAYQGFTLPLLGVAAPWISPRFALDTRTLAKLYALMSLSALVTLGAARLADRTGRRRTLVLCLLATSLASLGAALSRSFVLFAGFELARFSTAGALANSALLLLAEAAPDSSTRAAAVGKAGMAAAAGGSSLLVIMPLVAHVPHTFRWLYAAAAGGGLLLIPALLRCVAESAHWERARAAGSLRHSSVLSVFARPFLKRTAAVLGANLLGGLEGAAVGTWTYYFGVSIVGLSPANMSTWSLVATAAGFLGFRFGMTLSERLGRVRTTVLFGILHQVAALWMYLAPPRFGAPALSLGIGLCVSALGASASGTAKSTAGIELFPTALRVTLLGYVALAGAVATGLANLLVSALVAPLGGLARAVALVSLSGFASVAVFGLGVEETRGRALEESASAPPT